DLSLNASYWSPGVSGTQVLYLNNNPLTGQIVETVPGGASQALKDSLGFKFNNWTLGLSLNIPLNTVFSRAAYARAKVTLEQAMLQLKNQEQQVFLEIKQAVRAVETNFKRVQAYRVARELQEKKLQAEEEKYRVGLSTPYVVLTYQRDLANTQSQELRAIIDYNLSLARLSRALGTSLEEKNISLQDLGWDR
ncbi:MAG: TolC family protein, partial [Candidatus Aminicenantales bacterium]